MFLNELSRKHYTLLANLVSPATPDSKTFDQLVETLTNHFQPKSSIISERYSFHCRCQEPGKSLTDFVAGLTRLIVRCGYNNAFQPILLRDRFVCGLQNESTRKRLFTEDDALTLERALEIATSIEKASVNAKQMKAVCASVLSMSSNKKHHVPSSPSPTCHRCGGPHLAPNCRFIKEKCRSCGKISHIASVCRSKPLSTFPTRHHQKKPNRANTWD